MGISRESRHYDPDVRREIHILERKIADNEFILQGSTIIEHQIEAQEALEELNDRLDHLHQTTGL